MYLKEFAIYTAGWIGMVGVIWKLFDYLDGVSSPEFNIAVTKWIESISFNSNNHSKEIIAAMFVKVFGEKHNSWKCISRSIAYTTIIIIIICVFFRVFAYLNFQEMILVIRDSELSLKHFSFFLFCIYLQDFMMLYKTRVILNKAVANQTKSDLKILFLDFALTIIIVLITYFILAIIEYFYFILQIPGYGFIDIVILEYRTNISGAIHFIGWDKFNISIFLGTLWLLIIQISGLLTKLTTILSKSINSLKLIIDIKNKPIKSLGAIATMGIIILYLISLPLFFYIKLK